MSNVKEYFSVHEYIDGHEHNADDGSGWEPDFEVVCENDDPADPSRVRHLDGTTGYRI